MKRQLFLPPTSVTPYNYMNHYQFKLSLKIAVFLLHAVDQY